MSDIDEYNADATVLLEALEKAESDFIWSYMNPTYFEEDGEHDLSYFTVRATTKKRYAKGHLFMDQRVSRILAKDVNIDLADLLIREANIAAAERVIEDAGKRMG